MTHKKSQQTINFHHKKPCSYLGDTVLMTTQASNMRPSNIPPGNGILMGKMLQTFKLFNQERGLHVDG